MCFREELTLWRCCLLIVALIGDTALYRYIHDGALLKDILTLKESAC